MSIKDRSTYLHQNPITGVWMFQHRLEAFFSQYLLSDTHPLGHIIDYVIKIKFQRGSPHAHCLWWVKDAPKLTKIQMMFALSLTITSLKTVQNTLTTANIQNKSTQEFLQDINLHVDTYMEALQISQRGPNIILKQNPEDVFINACNQDILSLWRGNVDLQYVINETVKYVCSYMTRGEKGMGETLKRVAKECQNDTIRTQMNKVRKNSLANEYWEHQNQHCEYCQCG